MIEIGSADPSDTSRLGWQSWRIAVALIVSYPAPVFAEDEQDRVSYWYAGGGVAYTDISAGSFGGLSNGNDNTNSDIGAVGTVGYRIGRNFAAEVGYLDAGAPTFGSTQGFLCLEPNRCIVKVEQETKALTAAVLGILPFGETWGLFAKVGIASWEALARQTFSFPSGAFASAGRVDMSDTDLLFGFGASAKLTPRVRLYLDYEWFDTDDALLGVDRAAGFQQFALEAHWSF